MQSPNSRPSSSARRLASLRSRSRTNSALTGSSDAGSQPASSDEGTTEEEPPADGGTTPGGSTGGLGSGNGIVPGGPKVTVTPLPTTGVTVVDETLSYAEAVLQCTLDGYIDNVLVDDDPFDQCVEAYMDGKKK